MSSGFIKLQRTREAAELMRDPNAFALLALIACRANWSDTPNLAGLRRGQARIGDFAACGLTKKEYRGAKARLAAYGLATFTANSMGTVATLADSRVFSLRDERDRDSTGTQQGTQFLEGDSLTGAPGRAHGGHTEGTRRAPNSEGKKERRKRTTTPARPAIESGEGRALPEHSPLFCALAESCGLDPAELAGRAARIVAVALAEIRGATPDVTADELRTRAAAYARKMPSGCRITPTALAKHWASLGAVGGGDAPPPPEPPDWRSRLEELYPGNGINAESRPWGTVPESIKAEVRKALEGAA